MTMGTTGWTNTFPARNSGASLSISARAGRGSLPIRIPRFEDHVEGLPAVVFEIGIPRQCRRIEMLVDEKPQVPQTDEFSAIVPSLFRCRNPDPFVRFVAQSRIGAHSLRPPRDDHNEAIVGILKKFFTRRNLFGASRFPPPSEEDGDM